MNKLPKFSLQQFGMEENDVIERVSDLCIDYDDWLDDASDETVALLVIASKIGSVSTALYEQLNEISKKLDKLSK
ncbi:MAG: hypothetical protein LUE14_09585 [Clostridiales bacterium]|nr:hypothetical protein [Clostridiales bacterium]